MKVEQIYTGCLAQGAYYIESEGEAAIIDPLRETGPYMERAAHDGANIKYIFETHFHADFVSGHLSLADESGAVIVYGPKAETKFKSTIARDGEVFQIGRLQITALHTPGHTLESTTYLLTDENGNDHALFTGDTLFLGDVGRPDLAQKGMELSDKDLAGMLYESLRSKIMPLGDDVIIYPGHGAGSACGKNMMKETVDTLGNQKKFNYALRSDMTKEEFVKEVTDGLTPPPTYFPANVLMNKEGYDPVEDLIRQGKTALSPDAFQEAVNASGAMILDVRSSADFAASHISGSIFIGLDGGFAPWVGELIVDVKQPIALVVDQDREEEAITRLARVGFDHTIGYLKGSIEEWTKAGKPTETVESISPESFSAIYEENKGEENKRIAFDVRKETEYEVSHIAGIQNAPLGSLNLLMNIFPEEETFYIHCAGGYRSMIASSILKSRGFHRLINIEQGLKGMMSSGLAPYAVTK